jgi:RNA-directed DNA polymerase
MKIFHNFYNELIEIENIFSAWKAFKSGKSGRKEMLEFGHNLENNLFDLQAELKNFKYRHGEYEKFIVHDPKERCIHKAKVKDRVVHTLVAKKLEEIYQPVFIAQSYACQKDKGIYCALSDLKCFARKLSLNHCRNFWYLKCDVKKFFDNIDQRILIEIIGRKIKDADFLILLDEIIGSFYKETQGKGLPLGNFTSQWLANVYLNELDCFIKRDLRVKFYLRYADDILILDEDKARLEVYLKEIERFVNEKLALKLHENKTIFGKFSQGIEFVGYKVLPHYNTVKRGLKNRMLEKMAERKSLLANQKIGIWKYYETLNSYLGWLKHGHNHKLKNKITYQNYD